MCVCERERGGGGEKESKAKVFNISYRLVICFYGALLDAYLDNAGEVAVSHTVQAGNR
jgi:hypothetical protein